MCLPVKEELSIPLKQFEVRIIAFTNPHGPCAWPAVSSQTLKQWQVTEFCPESSDYDLIVWCHLDCEPHWGHTEQLGSTLMRFGTCRNTFCWHEGLGKSLHTVLLWYKENKIPFSCGESKPCTLTSPQRNRLEMKSNEMLDWTSVSV